MKKLITPAEYEHKALQHASDALDVLHAHITLQSTDTPLARMLDKQSKSARVLVNNYKSVYSARTNRESVALALLKQGVIDKADVKLLVGATTDALQEV